MRADARKNYDHLLTIARKVVEEQGVDASLRDIARRADVGLATLYRHFPTREALLEALLRTKLDELARQTSALEASPDAAAALAAYLRDGVTFSRSYKGMVELMAAGLADEASALHASCTELRAVGTRLLRRAQDAGKARSDLEGVDLFALLGALGWLNDQPLFAVCADHLVEFVIGAILTPGVGIPACTTADAAADLKVASARACRGAVRPQARHRDR